MSETVFYKGVLEKLHRKEEESLEEQCKRLLNGKELDPYYDSYQEQLLDENYNDYYIHEDVLYRVNRDQVAIGDDLFLARKIDNDKISFELMYYNGGCGFAEALDEALDSMK